MQGLRMSAAGLLLTLGVASPLLARGPGGHQGGGHASQGTMASPTAQGHTFNHGYSYSGKQSHRWSYRCWSSTYGCECFWCPRTCCWYYWCAPQCCYYPISYIPGASPVSAAVPASSQTVSQSVVVNSPGAALPPVSPEGVPHLPKAGAASSPAGSEGRPLSPP
jgi:hypothetical protein